MYARDMWTLRYAPLATSLLVLACQPSPQQGTVTGASPALISDSIKEFYMACSAAPPRSPEQQKLLLKMANKASNGKELLLVMRAAEGVFPAVATPPESGRQSHFRGIVTGKMIQLASLDELIEYMMRYSINAEDARPFIQRMLQLAAGSQDPRIWSRIQHGAVQWKLADLALQAEAKRKDLLSK